MDKRFAIILGIIVVVAGGLIFFRGGDKAKSNAQPTNNIYGKSDVGVTLVEYGDLECPACGQYYPLVKQLKTDFDGHVAFQYRNFPLETIHAHALVAARYAQAAALQGKFFEMHDLMYENQQTWAQAADPTVYFVTYAQQLGLNTAKLKTDANSSATNNVINADIAAGNVYKISGTPTFVLDGKKIDNPRDLDSFRKLLNDEIVAKGGKAVVLTSTSSNAPTTTQTKQ